MKANKQDALIFIKEIPTDTAKYERMKRLVEENKVRRKLKTKCRGEEGAERYAYYHETANDKEFQEWIKTNFKRS